MSGGPSVCPPRKVPFPKNRVVYSDNRGPIVALPAVGFEKEEGACLTGQRKSCRQLCVHSLELAGRVESMCGS